MDPENEPGAVPPASPAIPLAAAPAAVPIYELDDEDRADGYELVDGRLVLSPEAHRAAKAARAAQAQAFRDRQAYDARATAAGYPTVESLIAAAVADLEEAGRVVDNGLTPQETPHMEPTTPPSSPPPAVTPPAQPAVAAPPQVPRAAAPPAQAVTPPVDPTNDRALPEHQRRRLQKYREEQALAATTARAESEQYKTQVTGYQAQIAQMEAETSMQVALARTGISDMEFAWFEFRKHIKTLTADKSPEGVEKLKAFSADPSSGAKAWADEQRKTRPYLFGEMGVPANTGAPTGLPPAPAVPGATGVANLTAGAGTFDGRTASAGDFEKKMAAMGINYRGASPPIRH